MDPDPEAARGETVNNGNGPRPKEKSSILRFIKKKNTAQKRTVNYPWKTKEGPSWAEQSKLFQPGYPLYAALLARHSDLQNFRRFRTLRMRMLLLKQDRISRLEEELNEIDRTEEAELFLGSCRRDNNPRRAKVIEQLDEAFSQYDDFLQRSQWAINMPHVASRHVETQDNWLRKTGCIARPEVKYLSAEPYDLLRISKVKDKALSTVADVIEYMFVFLILVKRKMFSPKPNKESTEIIISKPLIRATARALTAAVAIILLLAPIIALNAVQRMLFRFIIVFSAATCFVTVITVASKASMAEIFAAGAAYSAVLVVFISGNGIQNQSQK